MSRAVPRHLLVVGAQRCGTTYLHDLLAAHPQIAMARPARPEPKVFLSDELAGRGRASYVSTYFGHARDEVLLGEKSTSYLEYAEAADRAAAVLGDPLVVAVLRDPVRRAVSHWAFSTDSGLEHRPLEEALAANLLGPLPWDPARTSVSPYAYVERGHFARYLTPWRERFGDDVHVVFLEELTTDERVLPGLYSALGVDADVRPPDTAGRPVNASTHATPRLSDELQARLRAHYRDSDDDLAEMLGRDLPWSDLHTPRGATP